MDLEFKTLEQIEDDARELLRMTFLDDNVNSEIYIKTHQLYLDICLLQFPPKKTLKQRLFRK